MQREGFVREPLSHLEQLAAFFTLLFVLRHFSPSRALGALVAGGRVVLCDRKNDGGVVFHLNGLPNTGVTIAALAHNRRALIVKQRRRSNLCTARRRAISDRNQRPAPDVVIGLSVEFLVWLV